jgi:hypothetical protein
VNRTLWSALMALITLLVVGSEVWLAQYVFTNCIEENSPGLLSTSWDP